MPFYANLGLKSSGYIIFVIRNRQISLKILENFVVIVKYVLSTSVIEFFVLYFMIGNLSV